MSTASATAPSLRFDGRILFLSQDPQIIDRQLAGEDLSLDMALPLRTDVSTDEITPANICYYYDEKLGEFPYLGLKCGDRTPMKAGSVKAGGFQVTVAGRRYGKGSSREASPFAELCAGIRLVIAESFERIYRQNCRNLGLLTSTDFGLIERIRCGESIPIDEFTRGEEELTAELIRRGGLFKLSQARRAGWAPQMHAVAPRPMTYAEKIISRARGGEQPVRPGESLFVRADWRYSHEYVTPMSVTVLERATGGDFRLKDPQGILCFSDHLTFVHHSMPAERKAIGLLDAAQNLQRVQQLFCEKHGLRLHGLLRDREGSEGISHSIMAERYVLPGQVAAGTDSHTTHCGALGALAFGVGATEIANSWVTGEVRLEVPRVCKVLLKGRLRPGVEAKDIALHILRTPHVREGHAIGQVFEYTGEALAVLPTDERATLTNMVAEMGGFTGIVAPDEETRRFLRERRGIDFRIEPWMCSDHGAAVAHTIEIDCSRLEPMLARPGDPGSGVTVFELRGQVPIDIAYGGSCTGGKREDLRHCHEVLEWAVGHNLKVHSGTRFIVQFGSQDVRDFCLREGMFEVFSRAGVELIEPGCGACVNAGPGVSDRTDQVTVSSINRNFPGRSGPGRLWLASPSTVAASAIAGRIVSFDQLRALFGE
ncbi:aconitase family protein [Variovorax sp. J22P240]|uniref:aconitase family protein n=1 Tax=Variovorax sp. J22P240 TaxID=3053514 RepID=UPI002578214E|nr:aconitase family protein [Variovorax sp. J22P240]MDM0001935.1 aconitase family protein [Variovorax sp. J22P240]